VKEILVRKDNTITGDLTSGGVIDLRNNTEVTGNVNENSDVAPVALPTLSYTASGEDITVERYESLTLEPGSYGDVIVRRGGSLTLSSGLYYMNRLLVRIDASLSLDIQDNSVGINVVENLLFGINSTIHTSDNKSTSVTFSSLQSDRINIKNGSHVIGTIIAPNAEVRLRRNSIFKGSIYADIIDVKKDASFQPHGSVLSLSKSFAGASIQSLERASNPTNFGLDQNYPNPFNPTTRILYTIPESGNISLKISNIHGQLIKTLVSGPVVSGSHEVVWDGRNEQGSLVASGAYLYRIQAGKFIQSRKMFFLK